jgi:hypothetical protein
MRRNPFSIPSFLFSVHQFLWVHALAARASRLVASRGTLVRELDLKRDPPEEEEVLSLLLGPTGNLRAPAFLIGSTLYVGFPREGFPGLR